jgi:hypothetical protein
LSGGAIATRNGGRYRDAPLRLGIFDSGNHCRDFRVGGIAVAAAGIAKVLFFIFIALFLIGLLTGRRPV